MFRSFVVSPFLVVFALASLPFCCHAQLTDRTLSYVGPENQIRLNVIKSFFEIPDDNILNKEYWMENFGKRGPYTEAPSFNIYFSMSIGEQSKSSVV